ncbi:Concanavalin A-like lectin/glucanase, subgroup [Cynara cardunculus var. scolymus]|uniref:RING-type E3 ubiquitin transferase n=1 Tax=Cynara cardunculus var. scolymus TaxID=59895 RepID=A0A103XNL3_CYNCS|nr:Concanavalin A-like lectin/glucanase, subgroup [Cynara cardunculus var. scolymus]
MNSTSTIDSDGSPSVVAVAVTGGNAGGIGGKGSRRAVCWAVENLFQKADRFVLIHVIPNITSIPNPSGKRIPIVDLDAHVVDMYVEDLKSHIEEVFLPFKRLCKGKKSCYLLLLLEPAANPNLKVMITESSSCGISKLWCGFCSSSRKSKIESTSASTQENASINSSTVKRSSSRRTLGDAISQTRVGNGTSMSSTCSNQSNLQAEVEKLRLELRNALNMYNQACDELVHTENKVRHYSFVEDAKKISSAVEREEKFRKIAAEEKEKHLEAVKEVEIARNLLAKEANEREIAELKALKESSEKQEVVDALFTKDKRYRRYSIDEIEVATDSFSKTKVVGEGAYGKVYKCNLDHTPVAIKVLWSDTSEKRREFLREVLSQLSHPHMVQLLGACPERGCLIYEYMENGSLEDYIFQATTTSYLSWSTRFRIAFEVACALAFLHNSKPEPIVHRDLKPGNILLDRNFVSKIGDVGMAKLITDVVPDNVTEYKDSILAGTMYYIDPEYHRTGTVRPKSDLYAFGIIVLQLLTSLQPKGIIPMVESAISRGTLSDILDDSIADWPLAEAEELAELGLKCCSLRCRDRPDLDTEVLPVLKKLYEFGDTSRKEVMDDPHIAADGFTYEHRAIQIWLERQNVSPMTKRKLQHKTLTPNHTLRSAIQDWRLRSTSSRSQV